MEDLKIVLFDTETTGLGFSAGICEIAFASFCLSELADPSQIKVFSGLINPGMPIEAGAMAVHGISDEDVAFSPKLEKAWEKMAKELADADFVSGYNSEKFDVPLMNANLARAGIEVGITTPSLDVMRIYQRIAGVRSGKLGDVCQKYGIVHQEQHRAKGDVLATIELLAALIREHGLEEVLGVNAGPEIPEDLLEIASRYREVKLQAEALEKELKALKEALLERIGDEDVKTPFLTVSTQPGRKMVDYKTLVTDLGLDKDPEEMAKYTKVSASSRVIRLV